MNTWSFFKKIDLILRIAWKWHHFIQTRIECLAYKYKTNSALQDRNEFTFLILQRAIRPLLYYCFSNIQCGRYGMFQLLFMVLVCYVDNKSRQKMLLREHAHREFLQTFDELEKHFPSIDNRESTMSLNRSLNPQNSSVFKAKKLFWPRKHHKQ